MNPNKRLLLTLLVSLGFNFSPRVHSFAIAPDGVKTDIPLQGDTQNLGSGISNAATIDTAQRGDSVQTLTVVNGNDAGAGSLRQAILDANATAGNDEIRFAPSVKLVTLTTARLDIDTTQGGLSLVAESSGSANVAIERSNANGTSNFSVFHIIGDGAVTMEGLTIRNGRGEMLAGGIVNEGKGTLTLTRSTVSGNRGRYAGGGIYSAGAVTLINSNASDNGGGAIMSSQTVTLINSIVSGNRQSASMRSAIHGREVILTNSTISNNDLNGIFSEEAVSLTSSAVSGNRGSGIFSKGAVSLTNSTVSSNVGKDFGGGIYSDRAVNLTNSTVSGNRAIKGGGGIYSAGGGTITNSTITNNEIVDNERQHGGGGLYASGTTPLAIRNSIIAGNFDLTRVPIDPNIRINTPNFDPTDSKHQFPDVFSANGGK